MKQMTTEAAVRIFAGVMVLIATGLVFWVSRWWMLFHLFIGINLIQSGITGFCLPEIVFKKMGLKSKSSCSC